MTTIHVDKIKDYRNYQLIYEMHNINDKINYFESKYSANFDDFEANVLNSAQENFDTWDDYMEWKAYKRSLSDLISEKEDIENGNYTISK